MRPARRASAEAAGALAEPAPRRRLGASARARRRRTHLLRRGGVVRVPIFEGGETRARVRHADAEAAHREAELADLTRRPPLRGRSRAARHEGRRRRRGSRRQARARCRARSSSRRRTGSAPASPPRSSSCRRRRAVAPATEQYIASVYAHAIAKAALDPRDRTGRAQFVALVGGSVMQHHVARVIDIDGSSSRRRRRYPRRWFVAVGGAGRRRRRVLRVAARSRRVKAPTMRR